MENHGQVTRVVSESAYHGVQLAERRLFVAIPAVFYLFAIMLDSVQAASERDEGWGTAETDSIHATR